ncbi:MULTISPECIES: cytochrome c biogenesis CcdA family protein [Microbacterium]|uniref:cytochrome c biogenesis CcdA family protein n=1 Tax=Microbacterium TaxID=33882 RepID=UPI00217D61B2|nr:MULTISPECIES: cytochrome c biogenesis protein CcdA [Microbacterium]UWF77834.1 cytochrome c biogenesis protein CcdA [Microbacterium neungamense]WCM56010.1 cytochrome c biogenesis protein CcdA [Microbacterium sp. EF45047]
MSPQDVIGFGALWVAIPLAMLAGLVSFLSPCVLPLVPGYLGFIGGAVAPKAGASTGSASGTAGASAGSAPVATATRGRLVLGVLLFIAGFTVVFVAYTVIGGAASVFFLEWGDLITRVLGLVIIAMGLVFLGLFGFAQREMRMHVNSATGLIGAPLLGFALGIGWAPCIGPTLAAITAVSWTLGDPWRAGLLGVAYSLGLGIPFLLVALGFGWASRAIAFLRRHIRVVNIVGGALLILLGVLMVTGLWTQLMSTVGAVMQSVELPL